MIRSSPDAKRSEWNRCADNSLSFGKLSSATHLAIALINLKCVVYEQRRHERSIMDVGG